MKSFRLLFVVIVLSSFGSAVDWRFPLINLTAWTATVSGHCNSNATWGGGGHPVSGDTFVVNSGVSVACDSTDGLFVAGTHAATTCTTDATVNAGGTFAVGDGGEYNHQGQLRLSSQCHLDGDSNHHSGADQHSAGQWRNLWTH